MSKSRQSFPELGELVREYRYGLPVGLVIGMLTVLGAGLFIIVFFDSAYLARGVFITILSGISLLAAGLIYSLSFLPFFRLRVRLYENGFVFVRGRSSQLFRWADIATVELTVIQHHDQYGGPAGISNSFRIHGRDGQQAEIDDRDFPDGEELGRTIMREHRRCEVKKMLQQALALESAEEWEPALSAFETLLRESPYNEIADQAREHVHKLRLKISMQKSTDITNRPSA